MQETEAYGAGTDFPRILSIKQKAHYYSLSGNLCFTFQPPNQMCIISLIIYLFIYSTTQLYISLKHGLYYMLRIGTVTS